MNIINKRKEIDMNCDNGCGNEAKFYSKGTKRWRCEQYPSQCPAQRQKREKSRSKESLEKAKKTCMKRYGVENPGQSEIVQQRMKETCISRYGVEFALAAPEVREKINQTILDDYGVENISQSEEIKEKKVQTFIKRLGVSNPSQSEEIKQKKKRTNLSRYNVENPMLVPKFVEKMIDNTDYVARNIETIKTLNERYGVDNISQVPEFRDKALKNSYKSKEYIFPSGRKEYCQGYEPQMIDWLLQNGYNEDDLIISDIDKPEIWYDFEDKKRRYFPDIFIKSENLIIEVKSQYTVTLNKDINKAKLKACEELGFSARVYVVNGFSVVVDPHDTW